MQVLVTPGILGGEVYTNRENGKQVTLKAKEALSPYNFYVSEIGDNDVKVYACRVHAIQAIKDMLK